MTSSDNRQVNPLQGAINALQLSINAMVTISTMSMFTGIIGSLATTDMFSLASPPEDLSIQKWNETTHYNHTKEDLIKIRDGIGDIYVYHGAPEEYAEQLVERGPSLPYSVNELGKEVAAKYGIPWTTFIKYAPRATFKEVFTEMSTAPALIAFRWASNFKQGEVLTDLNAHARLVKEARRLAPIDHISISDEYEKLGEKAGEIAKSQGLYWTSDNGADLLGLPDLYPRAKQTGAIVQIRVHASVLKNFAHDAGWTVRQLDDVNVEYKEQAMLSWNDSYRDMKIKPEDMLSRRIIVKGIPYNATNAVSDAVKKYETSPLTGKILSKRREVKEN